MDNILINFAGGMSQPEGTKWSARDWAPFRSCFPIRCFINDFVLYIRPGFGSIFQCCDGTPYRWGARPGEYGRDVAPEMLLESPYCPFRADIWQLGTMLRSIFGVCPQLLLLTFLLHGHLSASGLAFSITCRIVRCHVF